MWPFNKDIILKLAEKEWLSHTPIKNVTSTIVVEEARQVMSDLLGIKQKTPRSEIQRVFFHTFLLLSAV